jgi:predicted aminopeptidase
MRMNASRPPGWQPIPRSVEYSRAGEKANSYQFRMEYDVWFAGPVNNAQLNSVAAYYDLVPGFERLLEQNDGDLEKFYQAARPLAKGSRKQRDNWLSTLGKAQADY